MTYRIQKAMVIGSGVMGSGIAAHLANAGISVYLVDIAPDRLTPEEEKKGLTLESPQVRNRIVDQGMTFLKKSKPPGLFSTSKLDLIKTGNMTDNFEWAGDSDWIIEVVVEDLSIKQQVMTRIAETRRKGSIVSTNTSGIPIHKIAAECPHEFKGHFLGTHFFNPARYLKLLELIPTADTDPDLLDFMARFGSRRLGKTTVVCKDTPNFIANRVGVMMGKAAMNYMMENDFAVEEVDAVTGTLIGHPKTATFRLMDLVGLDIDQHVTRNLYEAIPHDDYRDHLLGSASGLTDRMVKKGLLGNKSGQGFYKKCKGPDGKKMYQVLNLESLEYRDREEPDIPLIKEAKNIYPLSERLRFLAEGEDRFSRLLWNNMAFSFAYCAHVIPEISDTLYAVDNAVKAGFFHEMGPFEIWDALGVQQTTERMEKDGFRVAPWVKKMLSAGADSFYRRKNGRKEYWDISSTTYRSLPVDPNVLILSEQKEAAGVVKQNPSASLVDMGDGVLCLEFHSKMNSLDPDIQALCNDALDRLERDFIGMVIGNQGQNFCVGANVFGILVAAKQKQWDVVEKAIKDMQDQMLHIRYGPKPVVAAPFGMTLGGGAEISMAADRMCASAETYMGLVEVGVGLVPAGGGCREILRRVVAPPMKSAKSDPLPFVMKIFENVATARVATSALEAKELGFLTDNDRIVMNGSHLLMEAKRMVIQMHEAGYVPPTRTKSIYALGGRALAFMVQGATSMFWAGYASAYDRHIANKVAYILAGGPLTSPQWVDEQYILDLEREVFLSLCGEERTLDRINHMLTTGRPLRN